MVKYFGWKPQSRLFTLNLWLSKMLTSLKFESLPLKSYGKPPKGSRIVFQRNQPSMFRGELLNFGGVKIQIKFNSIQNSKVDYHLTSWWLSFNPSNHQRKICSSNWISSQFSGLKVVGDWINHLNQKAAQVTKTIEKLVGGINFPESFPGSKNKKYLENHRS